jgi:hypothetical protein
VTGIAWIGDVLVGESLPLVTLSYFWLPPFGAFRTIARIVSLGPAGSVGQKVRIRAPMI